DLFSFSSRREPHPSQVCQKSWSSCQAHPPDHTQKTAKGVSKETESISYVVFVSEVTFHEGAKWTFVCFDENAPWTWRAPLNQLRSSKREAPQRFDGQTEQQASRRPNRSLRCSMMSVVFRFRDNIETQEDCMLMTLPRPLGVGDLWMTSVWRRKGGQMSLK
ncbi:hypothetical protein SRHO_G00198020, partial [Serrasalmus rhombeus]